MKAALVLLVVMAVAGMSSAAYMYSNHGNSNSGPGVRMGHGLPGHPLSNSNGASDADAQDLVSHYYQRRTTLRLCRHDI